MERESSMKSLPGAVCLLSLLALAGCASMPAKTFYPAGTYASWRFEPKSSAAEVPVLRVLPESGFGILGELAVGGGPNNSFQEMLDIAQREAAARGADFIVLTNQQVQNQQVVVPGFASAQQTSNASVSVTGSTGFLISNEVQPGVARP